MTTPLHLIGILDNGWNNLPLSSQLIIQNSASLFGGNRHIQSLPPHLHSRAISWKSPLKDSMQDILSAPPPITILASGNPMWHGIGKLLLKHFSPSQLHIIPAPSSFSLASSRLGWPMEDTTFVSLHHHPSHNLLPHLFPHRKIITLTRNASTLTEVASLLVAQNLPHISLTLLEHLGGDRERIISDTALAWSQHTPPVADLHCLAFQLPHHWEHALPLFGIKDNHLSHDNTITKMPIRALTLASLAFHPHAILWDIGAGSGSISIEWARMGGYAFAIEHNHNRFNHLLENIQRFGLSSRITALQGSAPEDCLSFPPPHAVFIGGGLAHSPHIFSFSQQHLLPHGRIVANAVTLESEKNLLSIHSQHGGSLSRISISHAENIGELHGWKPRMPLLHYVFPDPS